MDARTTSTLLERFVAHRVFPPPLSPTSIPSRWRHAFSGRKHAYAPHVELNRRLDVREIDTPRLCLHEEKFSTGESSKNLLFENSTLHHPFVFTHPSWLGSTVLQYSLLELVLISGKASPPLQQHLGLLCVGHCC
jgi:hypothetical protein